MICNINGPMRRRDPSSLLASVVTLSLFLPSSALGDDVYWTTKDLLKDFFRSSERVTFVTVEDPAALGSLLGYAPPKRKYVVFVARTKDRVDGYAVVDDEKGQHQPITFGVKISPKGSVERLEVMVYREGYGAEIRENRFRRQFEGKSTSDDIRFGSDVIAISGATISSKAMAVGVRRAIALVTLAERTVLAANGAGGAVAAR
jgi:hypothetical protein